MSLSLEIGWSTWTRFQGVSAGSSYVEIGWDLWGNLPHSLPRQRNQSSHLCPEA
jgi:hypothetical protein